MKPLLLGLIFLFALTSCATIEAPETNSPTMTEKYLSRSVYKITEDNAICYVYRHYWISCVPN